MNLPFTKQENSLPRRKLKSGALGPTNANARTLSQPTQRLQNPKEGMRQTTWSQRNNKGSARMATQKTPVPQYRTPGLTQCMARFTLR
ncbi:hypothetical protein WN55_05323 [Dufourea novaeangliae]|uniref:Uncharacterized protein n=1 Tax=Dufourea novaeangliae TaxID=178035 RepID=A0A154PLG7_DUFNO|nr:hypothetical protein WN55_05323 [Dufourea novaeangliae]